MKTFIPLLLSSLAWADDLSPLSDEFDTPASLASWQRLNDVEGWNADQLELWDADTTTTGHMRMIPYSSAWFMDLRGVLAFKEVTGNFVVTARITVYNRHDPDNPENAPNRSFSLAGIFAHAPRGISNANPSDGSSSDWMPDTDNYVFLSYGTAGNSGTRQYEVKTTRNGNSNLYFNNAAVPNTPEGNTITLQMVRVGDTIVVLRKHPGGEWILENRYPNDSQAAPIWGETVQVGITAYTDWPNVQNFYNGGNHDSQYQHNIQVFDRPGDLPDLIADVDYVRYARPDESLTEGVLQGLATSYPSHNTTALPANIPLGDVANVPLGGESLLDYALGTSTQILTAPNDTTLVVPLNPNGTAATLVLETSQNLEPDSWEACATRPAASRVWQSDLTDFNLTPATDGTSLTVTFPESQQRFFRLQVTVE